MGFTKELKNDHDLVYEALRTLIHRKSDSSTAPKPLLTPKASYEETLTPTNTRYVPTIYRENSNKKLIISRNETLNEKTANEAQDNLRKHMDETALKG